MKDYINIGPVPCEEDCAQVGQEGYREQAVKECNRFIDLLRKTFGDEPERARLAIKWFDHDFGSYCEVVCWYETEDEKAREYAFRCENETPLTWEEGAVNSSGFRLGRILITPGAIEACRAANINPLNLLTRHIGATGAT